jgi:hypothetical protein
MCGTTALPFTLKKSILRKKKKNYGNSNISPCKNIIIKKKNPLKESQNLSKSSYKNRPIIIKLKILSS